MRDTRLYINEIHAALESILIFTKDYSFDAFKNDDKTSSAVIRKFEIIGEADRQINTRFYQSQLSFCSLEKFGRIQGCANPQLFWYR